MDEIPPAEIVVAAKAPWHTWSFWGAVAAVTFRLLGCRRVAGTILFTVGVGYVGVQIERHHQDDLRLLRHAALPDLRDTVPQTALHFAAAWIGWKWLK